MPRHRITSYNVCYTKLLRVSGHAALEQLRSNEYDIIMLDIQMPGLSGFDVIKEYRQLHPVGESVPIVVITGDATQEA